MNTNTASVLLNLKSAIRSNGYAWPGGYPLYAVMADGEAMSISACKKEFRMIARATIMANADSPQIDKEWTCVGIDINWEDSALYCAHTNERIESAYAENEA